ncbi:MAG: hypothetical protein HOQ24_08135 [Mycobacteriaceae bacterium]|nr:hypothetical protein [Mycobacteriaceae bacterium]
MDDLQELRAEIPWFVQLAVFGDQLPEMGISAMRRLARQWRGCGDALQTCRLDVQATAPATGAINGATGAAMTAAAKRACSDLTATRDYCYAIADQIEVTAADTEKSVIEMLLFGAMVTYQLAVLVSSGGVSAIPGIALLASARRKFLLMLEMCVARLGAAGARATALRLGLLGGTFGLTNAGLDYGIQLGQLTLGHRNSIDGSAVAAMGLQGIGSVVGGHFGAGLANKALGGAAPLIVAAAAGGFGGVVGSAAAVAPLTGQIQFTPAAVVSSIAQGLVGGLAATHAPTSPAPALDLQPPTTVDAFPIGGRTEAELQHEHLKMQLDRIADAALVEKYPGSADIAHDQRVAAKLAVLAERLRSFEPDGPSGRTPLEAAVQLLNDRYGRVVMPTPAGAATPEHLRERYGPAVQRLPGYNYLGRVLSSGSNGATLLVFDDAGTPPFLLTKHRGVVARLDPGPVGLAHPYVPNQYSPRSWGLLLDADGRPAVTTAFIRLMETEVVEHPFHVHSGDAAPPASTADVAQVLLRHVGSDGIERFLLAATETAGWGLPGGAVRGHEHPTAAVARVLHTRHGVTPDALYRLWHHRTGSAAGAGHAIVVADAPQLFPTPTGSSAANQRWISRIDLAELAASGGLEPRLSAGLADVLDLLAVPPERAYADFPAAYRQLGGDYAEVRQWVEARLSRHPEWQTVPVAGLAALHAYTTPVFFKEMNAALMADDPGLLARYEVPCQAVTAAVRRLPPVSGTVFRDIRISDAELPAVLARYRAGAHIVERGFVSASTGGMPSLSPTVRFVIESSTGRNIQSLSDNAFLEGAEEVLFAPGAHFIVREPAVLAGGVWTIQLDEVAPHASDAGPPIQVGDNGIRVGDAADDDPRRLYDLLAAKSPDLAAVHRIMSTLNGWYGPHRLEIVEVTKLSEPPRHHMPDPATGEFRATDVTSCVRCEARVLDSHGSEIGFMYQQIVAYADGRLVSYVTDLELTDPKHRNRGFATEFTAALDEFHQRHGFDRFRLTADGRDKADGSRVWARLDYRWDMDPLLLNFSIGSLRDRAAEIAPGLSAGDADRLRTALARFDGPPAGYPTPRELERMPGIGPLLMTETRWYAERIYDADTFPGIEDPLVLEFLYQYQIPGFARMLNMDLRTGWANVPSETRTALEPKLAALDEAMQRLRVPRDTDVVRAIGGDHLGDGNLADLVGSTWTDAAYLSTTLGHTPIAYVADKELLLHLRVPKGTPGILIPGTTELLLARNTKYLIDRVDVAGDGRTRAYGRVLLP